MLASDTLHLVNQDCRTFLPTVADASIQCIVCDPPFGLGEDTFEQHYARDSKPVLSGYQTAPKDAKQYEEWAKTWISHFPRILKPDGTAYIVCAWNHLCDIELAIRSSGLTVVNHIIWKYNFGVYTQKKFVTSHYHILRCAVGSGTPAFYSRAYFSEKEKTGDGHNAQYTDMEDVWMLQKDFAQGEIKNINKLPDALVEKLLRYSSKPGDTVADFFLGNFTTAYVARRLGRKVIGCEMNPAAYTHHAPLVAALSFPEPETVSHEKESTKPKRAGKKITEEEKARIVKRYKELHETRSKKDSMAILETEFERGHFSLLNLLKAAGL